MRDLAIPTETLKFIISSKMNHFTWIIAPASVAEGEHDLKLEILSEEPACRKARSTGIVMVASSCLGHRETLVGRPVDTNDARLDYMEDAAFSWSTNIGTAQYESLKCLEKPLKEVIRLFQWCQRQDALRRGPSRAKRKEDVAGSHSARLRNQDNCRNHNAAVLLWCLSKNKAKGEHAQESLKHCGDGFEGESVPRALLNDKGEKLGKGSGSRGSAGALPLESFAATPFSEIPLAVSSVAPDRNGPDCLSCQWGHFAGRSGISLLPAVTRTSLRLSISLTVSDLR
jgi:hypothetical protein